MHTQRGSIYLVTLITVAAIVSMIFIGIALRSTSSTKSALIQEMTQAGNGVLDANEFALQRIIADPQWKTTAQTGTVFSPMSLGDTSLTSSVVDTATGITPTFDTSSYRVQVNSTHESVKSSAQIDLLVNKPDCAAYYKSLSGKLYWALNEWNKPVSAIDQISGKDGKYLDPNIAGQATNDEGGLVPVFGVANDPVMVPYNNHFDQKNAGSVAMWMNLSKSASKVSTYGVFGQLYKLGGVPTINLSVIGYGLSAYIAEGGVFSYSNFALTPFDSIIPGTWHHVAMTWGAKGLTVYIDGVEKANRSSCTQGMDTAASNKGGEQPFHIGGGYSPSFGANPQDPFEGSIGHFVLFDDQLTAAQVLEMSKVKPDLSEFAIVEGSWVRVFE